MAMPVERYRITVQTLGVFLNSTGGSELLQLPAGSVVAAPSRVFPIEDPALTEVLWEGKRVRIFTVDFQERSERVMVQGQ